MADQDTPGADLEIIRDDPFERLFKKVQRAAWGVGAAILAAALLGLFGSGPLSRATAGDRDGPIRVEYERFGRYQTPTRLTVRLGPRTGGGRETRVWIDREYLEAMTVQSVSPEPLRVEAGPDRHTFVFARPDPGRPTAVVFELEPEEPGRRAGRVGLAGGAGLSFRQFIYP